MVAVTWQQQVLCPMCAAWQFHCHAKGLVSKWDWVCVSGCEWTGRCGTSASVWLVIVLKSVVIWSTHAVFNSVMTCHSGVPTNFFGEGVVPGIFFGGGGGIFNNFSWGQREQGSGGGNPLGRGSTQFAHEWNPYSDQVVTDVQVGRDVTVHWPTRYHNLIWITCIRLRYMSISSHVVDYVPAPGWNWGSSVTRIPHVCRGLSLTFRNRASYI
jgi:hypothetical protein